MIGEVFVALLRVPFRCGRRLPLMGGVDEEKEEEVCGLGGLGRLGRI